MSATNREIAVLTNDCYRKLDDDYLFYRIAGRIKKYSENAKGGKYEKVINLSVGDVTGPLPKAAVAAIKTAAEEQLCKVSFRGYPPVGGYDFLRHAISERYRRLGVELKDDEIFVTSSSKSDAGDILETLGDNTVFVTDPVYPVYRDAALMFGRKIVFLDTDEQNGFIPMPPNSNARGIFFLCSPNNPTGTVYSREVLKLWVEYANKTGSLIVFDAAYEAFITDDSPHSIYCIDGAEKCAVELCSFSKTAGFTGLRCAYAVVPDGIVCNGEVLKKLWIRRQSTRTNGVSYIIQRAAEAVMTEMGRAQCLENIRGYLENASILADGCKKLGIVYTGGISSPYIWMKCMGKRNSWEFFDFILENAGVAGTPGVGFGNCGEGYYRLSAFGTRENTEEAVKRLTGLLG